MTSRLLIAAALCGLSGLAAGCLVGDDPVAPDGDGNDGTGVQPEAASPDAISIGFDGGAGQFDYFADFYGTSPVHQSKRLCHGYFSWNVGTKAPYSGEPTATDSRAYLDAWLAAAQGHCDQVLIAFKAMTPRAAPDEASYTAAFAAFVATDWATETGYTGSFAFSPWNEPNNPADAGNGLGVKIEAQLAARYYLAATRSCKASGCLVAAGDFASNGDMWNDFEWNCANDNVPTDELCDTYSNANPQHHAASYLDKYKNEIARHANDAPYRLGAGFRPAELAYHGWHDTNGYLDSADHCTGYDDCAARRLMKSLGGSWASVALWDTEDGMGQKAALSDHEQACGAAFLLRLASVTSRVRRVYITRLDGGDLQLEVGHTARPALIVLADRRTTYEADCK